MSDTSESAENSVPQTSEDVEALYNSVMEPNVEPSEPTEGESEQNSEEPSEAGVNEQADSVEELFTLKHKDFEDGERQFSRDKVTEYAQKGFDYELKMHQLKTERAAFEEKMQELEESQKKFSEKKEYWESIDKYMMEMEAYEALDEKERKGLPAPVLRRIVCGDSTIEGIRNILRKDGGSSKVVCMWDELSGWLGSFDMYRKTGSVSRDRAAFMELYEGGPKYCDRQSAGFIYVQNWSACICGTIVPKLMQDFFVDY